jgi:hypothetical protein
MPPRDMFYATVNIYSGMFDNCQIVYSLIQGTSNSMLTPYRKRLTLKLLFKNVYLKKNYAISVVAVNVQ